MPAIVSATVLEWKVVDPGGRTPVVEFVSSTLISIYVGDGTNDTDVAAITAAYILENPNEENEKDLLKAARDGLLQVTGLNRLEVVPPAVPPPEAPHHGGHTKRPPKR
jgi:hypothetical protein